MFYDSYWARSLQEKSNYIDSTVFLGLTSVSSD